MPCGVADSHLALPPAMQPEFEEAMLVPDATYIRAPTYRKNISYRVEICSSRDAAEKQACEILKECSSLAADKDSRAILFCDTKNRCERMAKILGSDFYHSSHSDKDRAFEMWQSGDHKCGDKLGLEWTIFGKRRKGRVAGTQAITTKKVRCAPTRQRTEERSATYRQSAKRKKILKEAEYSGRKKENIP